jgi:hypothetical protein
MEKRVHLQRAVEVVLDIQDREAEVRPAAQHPLEIHGSGDGQGLVAGLGQMPAHGVELGARKRDGDCPTRHSRLPSLRTRKRFCEST